MSQAICLGDVGFFLAMDLLTKLNIEKEKMMQMLSYFAKIVQQTITGQMLDMHFSQNLLSVSERDVIQIAKFKTGYYTIVAPFVMGALLAGAKKKLLYNLSLFGEQLGIAFQIKDDILGIVGDEQLLGKSVKSDIEEGKNTLLFIYAQKVTSTQQKQFLINHYGKGKISNDVFIKMKKIFVESGALLKAEKKFLNHANNARKIIPLLTKDTIKRKLLNDLVNFLIQRDR